MRITLLLLSIVCIQSLHCQTFDWTNSYAQNCYSFGSNVEYDQFGNMYFAGETGCRENHGPSLQNGFVCKYTQQGIPLWSKSFSSPVHIATSGSNLLVSGKDSVAYFVEKYDGLGNLISRTDHFPVVNKIPDAIIQDIAADNQGNYYLAAIFRYTLAIGGQTLYNSEDESHLVIAKFDQLGHCLWVNHSSGGHIDVETTINADDSHVYVTASFLGTLQIGNYSIPSQGISDAMIAKFAIADGELTWLKKVGGGGQDVISSHCIDQAKNIYCVGYYDTPFTIGSDALSISGKYEGNIFVSKFDSLGEPIWARQAGGLQTDIPGGIFNTGQDLYVTGGTRDDISFGSITIPVDPVRFYLVPFVAKYDLHGNVIWAIDPGCDSKTTGYVSHVSADYFGRIIIAGRFAGTIDFNGNTLKTGGEDAAFIARLVDHNLVSVQEQQSEKDQFLTLFPNPATSEILLNLNSEETTPLFIRITNNLGEVKYLERIATPTPPDRITLDVSTLAPGMYFVDAIGERKRSVGKMIVEGK